MSGTFDPDTFMNTDQDGEFSTSYEPIPEGEYQAVITKIEPRTTSTGKALLDVTWQMDAPDEDLAHEKFSRQSIWLDLTESGGLDRAKGKNIQLGRLLDAVGVNGSNWNPNQLIGSVARVNVKHRITDDGQTFADVKGATKA